MLSNTYSFFQYSKFQSTHFYFYSILRFQDSGIMQRMKKMYFKKIVQSNKDYDSVGLLGIAPLITILFFGIILSIFVLIVEKLHHSAKYASHENLNGVKKCTSPRLYGWRE